MANLSWHEAGRLKVGDRVVFPDGWDIFPWALVGEGERGTVTHQRLDHRDRILCVLPDNPELREALSDWDGEVIFDSDHAGSDWTKPSPLAKLDANAEINAALFAAGLAVS